MPRIRRAVITGTAALAVLAASATPASAATTTIRAGSASAPAYSGNVQASLLGTATVSTSLGEGSCSESQMTGSIASDGTDLQIDDATFGGPNGGSCSGSTSADITVVDLPWAGGSVEYDAAHTDGRDAAVTIANFKVEAEVQVLFLTVTCEYGGDLTANGYNGDNGDRPVTGNGNAQVGVEGATVYQTGGDGLCPDEATVTATYELLGESTAGSGSYDQPLHVTS